jgi:hypothetical protein
MIKTIGIDFDNTIANYDNVFKFIALENKLIPQEWLGNKKQLRDLIRTQENGEHEWQKIQGKVYGKYMYQAELFHGLSEFFFLCKFKNIKIYIISHKTEFGHFDEEKISLRGEAFKWMEKKQFFYPDYYGIFKENIFFLSTREEKINKIYELQCDIFIDDLLEVFFENSFPKNIKKILFDRDVYLKSKNEVHISNSWRQISKFIFGEITEIEVQTILKNYLSYPTENQIEILKGSGNSKIFKIITDSNKSILKIYPDREIDNRPRLENEFKALKLLSENGFPVPKPIQKWNSQNWAVYEFIEGNSINKISKENISEAIEFCKKLKQFQKTIEYQTFPKASEACLSGKDILLQINYRIELLEKINNFNLQSFVKNQIKPLLINLLNKYSENKLFNISLSPEFQILSPSDFGFHNAFLTKDNIIKFYDFEYFGWDDPAKLISDFYWHPGMNLSSNLKLFWLEEMAHLYQEDKNLTERMIYFLPFIGLRWVLILLNEFRDEKLSNRMHANDFKEHNIEEIKSAQLEKSIILLEKIKDINLNSNKMMEYSVG